VPSPDGTLLAVVRDDAVDLRALSSATTNAPEDGARVVATFPVAGVQFVDWSPAGRFLVTAKRPPGRTVGQAPDPSPPPNVAVWDVEAAVAGGGNGSSPSTAPAALELLHRTLTRDAWPCVRWSGDDDAFAYYAVTNTVHVYSARREHGPFRAPQSGNNQLSEGPMPVAKVGIKGVGAFAPCPTDGKAHLLAAFVPEGKGQPASASVFDFSAALEAGLKGGGSGEGAAAKAPEPVVISRRSFYRASGAEISWNSTGTVALVTASSDTDATNQSYYGESKLHFLPADPARAGDAAAVPLPKEGPVHDVQWSPQGDFFVVVAGFMPAKAILVDTRNKPVYDVIAGPYNTARWSPSGRFLAVCGFGNLPGDVIFFNRLGAPGSGKITLKRMGSTRAEAVSCAWSPCGRMLLTATVAPRLRVDNNVRVLSYTGEVVAHRAFECLLEARWVPQGGKGDQALFEDRAPSPERLARSLEGGGAGGGGGGAKGGAGAAAPARPATYVPPSMRGAAAAGRGGPIPVTPASSAQFSLAHDANSRTGRIGSGGGGGSGGPGAFGAGGGRAKNLPPGAEALIAPGAGKAAAKNAKRRAAAKKKAEEDGGGEA
jgi:translation initiation factor 2A